MEDKPGLDKPNPVIGTESEPIKEVFFCTYCERKNTLDTGCKSTLEDDEYRIVNFDYDDKFSTVNFDYYDVYRIVNFGRSVTMNSYMCSECEIVNEYGRMCMVYNINNNEYFVHNKPTKSAGKNKSTNSAEK